MSEGYKERYHIVVASCDGCPFKGKCKPWKKMTSKQRVTLALSTSVGNFILKGCPLPRTEDGAEPFDLDSI